MTCTRDDQIIVGVCHTNEPAYLVQFDDASRRFVAAIRIDSAVKDDATWRVKQAKIHTQLYELSDGWVYGGTHCSEHGSEDEYAGGHWFRYDPRSHGLEDMGLAMAHEGLIAMDIDEANRCLYAVTYPGAYLLRFDLPARKTQVVGQTSIPEFVSRVVFVLEDGCVYVSQVRSAVHGHGGIYVYNPAQESGRAVFPTVFRRDEQGHHVVDQEADGPNLYGFWLAGTTNGSRTVAYATGYLSGHLFSLRPVRTGVRVVYDHGPTVAGAQCHDSHGPFSHAMCCDANGRIVFTVVTEEATAGKKRTHLLRYVPEDDRLVDLGLLVDSRGAHVVSSTAMTISSTGTIFLVGRVEDQATALLRVDLKGIVGSR